MHLAQPPAVTAAYAATVRSLAAMTGAFNAEIAAMEEQVKECFGQARDAEICQSQPGLGPVLAARVLGEFGDDEHRYATAKNRKNHAGTSPITRASGKKKTVLARHIHNDRLADACTSSPSAPSPPHQAPAPTTTSSAAAARATTPCCASWPTGSSASSTAASKPAPSTTNTPPGHTTAKISKPLLDNQSPWGV